MSSYEEGPQVPPPESEPGVGLCASGFETLEEFDEVARAADMDMDGMIVTLLRREDMLVLEFRFKGLLRTGSGAQQRLVTKTATEPGFLMVRMPPQATLEEATPQSSPSTAVKRAWFAGPSALSLRVAPGSSVPLTAAGLLDWAGLATSSARLECVWGLGLTPATVSQAAWLHAAEPVSGPSGAVGIWHTRLALPADGSGPPGTPSRLPVPVKAAEVVNDTEGFMSSLSPPDRRDIGASMARRPALARDLTFTPLGANVDLTGNWLGLAGISVLLYHHESVGGRDTTVNVLKRGYLLPFGFPALITTQTERRLDHGLVKSSVLTVLLPELTYQGVAALPNGGRGFPFTRVRLNGPLTADVIDATDPLTDVGFWIRGPGAADGRLRFSLTAEDQRGHPVAFTAPLVFVKGDRAHGDLTAALDTFNRQAEATTLPASGRLELARTTGLDPESTTVDVMALRIRAVKSEASQAALEEAGRLAALPELFSVDARIPALEALAARGAAQTAGTAVPAVPTLLLESTYVRKGLAATRQVYARLKDPVSVAPPVTASGGVAKLDLPVTGLSSVTGLVGGDLDKFMNGTFSPASFFSPPPPPPSPTAPPVFPTRLLGFIDLTKLVPPVAIPPAGAGDGTAVPRMLTTMLRQSGRPPHAVETTLTWQPKLPPTREGPLQTTDRTQLDLRCVTVTNLDRGGPPVTEVRGTLSHFTLSFAEVLDVEFQRLAFTSKPGTTTSLDVKVGKVEFSGQLRFLDRLREYLPSVANGPRVNVDTNGIDVGYTLAVPSVGLGVFLLQNLALSVSVRLPFDGTPMEATFKISSREHPFLATVSLFGGGGFLALTVRTGEVVRLEGQVEFGAAVSLNLGVASGSVSVTAGVYIELDKRVSSIRGFLRAYGELDVLGIVNVSVEFYLALAYRTPKTLYGWASVTVRVRVAFFSESVTMKLERSFSGGDDPSFGQAFPTSQPWRDRCAAFAPMEAS
ncbi:hypothetical protein KPP03845_200174 (plasmid) [Streptomyces xanthophaeus]|uniref:hypothetical protein n=1 Tax=Streptomyces xanthophaeus TaxID=67385 RepID=UPI00233ECEFE|nr:hypothetical protein [Streptomyces xanthophaeus]WCD91213.1 hypothetical protein KPP03845_200174 [Streptomyces xanthophaeus]